MREFFQNEVYCLHHTGLYFLHSGPEKHFDSTLSLLMSYANVNIKCYVFMFILQLVAKKNMI